MYPWQQTQWQLLLQQIRANRLPHALLLTGAQGLGLVEFARALAGLLLCQQVSEKPCGTCRPCQLYASANHPDFFTMTLEEQSKFIKVDQVRTLVIKLTKTAQYEGKKIVLFYPAEAMNQAAANALLKTLEEPPGDTLFLLVSYHLGRLPATIISRTQRIHFYAANDAATQQWVAAYAKSSMQPQQLLNIAYQAPILAAEMDDDYFALRDQLFAELNNIQLQQQNPIANVAEYVKQDVQRVLTILIGICTDCLRLQLGANSNYLTHADQLVRLQTLARVWQVLALQRFIDQCQQALQLYRRSAGINPQLLLEKLLLSLSESRGS